MVGRSGMFASYIDAFRYLQSGHEILQEGYVKVKSILRPDDVYCIDIDVGHCVKYPGRIFRVALLDRWMIVAAGSKLVDDIRKAPDEQLSMDETGADVCAHSSFYINFLTSM